MRIRYG